jgi:hypothetical protein
MVYIAHIGLCALFNFFLSFQQWFHAYIHKPKLKVGPLPNHATSSVRFDFDDRLCRVPNIISVLRYTAPCTELDFIFRYTRRLRNDAQTHLLPQKFLKNLHIVQQLGLVGFSFLAESFYQNYHGIIRIWPGDIAVYARTDWSFGTRRRGNNPSPDFIPFGYLLHHCCR